MISLSNRRIEKYSTCHFSKDQWRENELMDTNFQWATKTYRNQFRVMNYSILLNKAMAKGQVEPILERNRVNLPHENVSYYYDMWWFVISTIHVFDVVHVLSYLNASKFRNDNWEATTWIKLKNCAWFETMEMVNCFIINGVRYLYSKIQYFQLPWSIET